MNDTLKICDYCVFRYNGICLMVQKLVNIIKQMDPRDPFRIEMTDMLLDKL